MNAVAQQENSTTYLDDMTHIDFFLDTMENYDEVIVNNDGTKGIYNYSIEKSIFGYSIIKNKFFYFQGIVEDEELVNEQEFDFLIEVKGYFNREKNCYINI